MPNLDPDAMRHLAKIVEASIDGPEVDINTICNIVKQKIENSKLTLSYDFDKTIEKILYIENFIDMKSQN